MGHITWFDCLTSLMLGNNLEIKHGKSPANRSPIPSTRLRFDSLDSPNWSHEADHAISLIYPIGSMVLLYMVLHGSHQYTLFMLAYIPAPWILWVLVCWSWFNFHDCSLQAHLA